MGGVGAGGESAFVPAAAESCKSGENRDVSHLSAAGRLRSLELPAASRMYGFFLSPKCYALITPVDVVLGSLDRRM